MSAKDRTPTTRLLALAAFLLAVGLLSLRAYDLFGTIKTDPVGSAVERELTYLLEPITGLEKVRVSVTGRSAKSVLVMVDGDIATDLRPLRSRVEEVLVASIDFSPETDTLTLSQFPFARGIGGTLTSLQIAELTGLGLLSLILLGTFLSPSRPAPIEPRASKPRLSELAPARLTPPDMKTDQDLQSATQLAENKPNETANLVRGWMTYAED